MRGREKKVGGMTIRGLSMAERRVARKVMSSFLHIPGSHLITAAWSASHDSAPLETKWRESTHWMLLGSSVFIVDSMGSSPLISEAACLRDRRWPVHGLDVLATTTTRQAFTMRMADCEVSADVQEHKACSSGCHARCVRQRGPI